MADVSGNTRSKIRRGRKHFEIRIATPEEISVQGIRTCRNAVKRYGRKQFLPSAAYFDLLARTMISHPSDLEVVGVFKDGELMAFSENHIQKNGVLFDSIWFDPQALAKYSSYSLFDYMLNRYLTEQRREFVSDGARTLYHDSGIHNFLMQKFLFEAEYFELEVVYKKIFGMIVWNAYPFRKMIHGLSQALPIDAMAKASAILTQEEILRDQYLSRD